MKHFIAISILLAAANYCHAARFITSYDNHNVVPDEYIVTFKSDQPASNLTSTISPVTARTTPMHPTHEQALERTQRLLDRITQLRASKASLQEKKNQDPNRHKQRIRQIYNGSFSGFAGQLSKVELDDVLDDEDVEVVEPNLYTTLLGADVPPMSWALDRIDQRSGTDNGYIYNALGFGVHVFVLDNGVNADLSEFTGRIGEGFDSFGEGHTGDCADMNNFHGTVMAALIAGTKSGVAKQAIIHPVRVLKCSSGTLAEIIAGLNWAANTSFRPAVINLSVATGRAVDTYKNMPMSYLTGKNIALKNALRYAKSSGITIVTGAGNEGLYTCGEDVAGSVWYVGGAVVSGTDSNDTLAGEHGWPEGGSNADECTTINAPWGANTIFAESREGYFDGTSVSSALVSGAVALVLGAYPGIDPLNDGEKGLYANATKLSAAQAGSRRSLVFPYGMHANTTRFLYTRYITDKPPVAKPNFPGCKNIRLCQM